MKDCNRACRCLSCFRILTFCLFEVFVSILFLSFQILWVLSTDICLMKQNKLFEVWNVCYFRAAKFFQETFKYSSFCNNSCLSCFLKNESTTDKMPFISFRHPFNKMSLLLIKTWNIKYLIFWLFNLIFIIEVIWNLLTIYPFFRIIWKVINLFLNVNALCVSSNLLQLNVATI